MQKNHFLTKTVSLVALVVFFLIFNSALAETVAAPDRELIPEPTIRVGLYKTNEPVKFVSDFSYEVWSGDKFRGVIPANETTTLSYKKIGRAHV